MSGKRRATGEGGLYQRQDGKWEGVLNLGYGQGGKRSRRKVVAKTQAQARERLKHLRAELESSRPLPPAQITVGSWLNTWLEAHTSVKPRTFLTYSQIVQQHLVPSLGRTSLQKLSPLDVSRYMASKVASGLSAKTVGNHHGVLRAALRKAEELEYVNRNVARVVSPPKKERFQVEPLTLGEARDFLAAIAGHRFEALYVVAMATGLRRAELLGLSWRDVDVTGRTLRVEQTLLRYGGAYHLDPPKTETSRRTVGLHPGVIDALRVHRARQAEERLGVGPLWEGDQWGGLVFTNEQGAPLNEGRVTRTFQRLLVQAGIRQVRLHDLRHGVATFALTEGVPMKTVQQILGHSTMQITADTYSHVIAEVSREGTDRVGNVLFGTR